MLCGGMGAFVYDIYLFIFVQLFVYQHVKVPMYEDAFSGGLYFC